MQLSCIVMAIIQNAASLKGRWVKYLFRLSTKCSTLMWFNSIIILIWCPYIFDLKRCDDDSKQREPILKQLIAMDTKKGQPGHLTGIFEKALRELLIHSETKSGHDMCHVLCCLGNTSLNEANHARVIRRGYHVKGDFI